MDWKKKIQLIEEATGTSISKTLKKYGFSSSVISDLRIGRSQNPNSDFIAKLFSVYNLNPRWLFNDEGSMFLSENKPIKIQHIMLDKSQVEDNSILFLWPSVPKVEQTESFFLNLDRTIKTFKETNGNLTTLFIPYFGRDFSSANIDKSDYLKKLTLSCTSNSIALHTFEITDNMIDNPDSINCIKNFMKEKILPSIHLLRPTHLWLGLQKSDCETTTHAILGLYVLDQYFDNKNFPPYGVTLLQIDENPLNNW